MKKILIILGLITTITATASPSGTFNSVAFQKNGYWSSWTKTWGYLSIEDFQLEFSWEGAVSYYVVINQYEDRNNDYIVTTKNINYKTVTFRFHVDDYGIYQVYIYGMIDVPMVFNFNTFR